MPLSETFGWIGLAFAMVYMVPQLLKTWRNKSAADVSALSFILLNAAFVCFLIRAIVIREYVFIINYAFSLMTGTLQIILIWKYRKK
jgi:MtN3 and saliva related transmembrane protein